MKLSDKSHSKVTRVAIVGLSGSGKSTLAANLSEQYKLWWFTLDNDSDILFKLPPAWQENVELFDLPDSASYPVAADTLMKLFKEKKGSICHSHGLFNCPLCRKDSSPVSEIDFTSLDPKKDIVIIDSGSQLSHSILAKATKGQPVDYKPERDDWGVLRKWTEFFYSEFQAAKFNLIVIFHAIEATLEDDRAKLVPAFGSKDMSTKIAGAFSHIVYTDLKNKKHIAFSSSTYSGSVLTKSRTNFEIEKLAEPSLIPIFSGVIPETLQGVDALPNKATTNTPANKSMSALEAIRAKIAAGKE